VWLTVKDSTPRTKHRSLQHTSEEEKSLFVNTHDTVTEKNQGNSERTTTGSVAVNSQSDYKAPSAKGLQFLPHAS
jgi:hypothetical protein